MADVLKNIRKDLKRTLLRLDEMLHDLSSATTSFSAKGTLIIYKVLKKIKNQK